MNLQTQLAPELWKAIETTYEAGHYRLRLNALGTESERNVQKGVEQILRGIYLAIRSPRSHEQQQDSKEQADAIIHFLNYLLHILNASRPAFTVDGFMQAIADPEFVESPRYAEVLLGDVPVARRADVLLAIFAQRKNFNLRKLRHVIQNLLALLSEAQTAHYLAVVSDELRTVTDDGAIRTCLQMLTPDLWPRIAESARLRIENKLIRSMREGEVLLDGRVLGSLGAWSNAFIKTFTLRDDAAGVVLAKLGDSDPDDRRYITKYFFAHLPDILGKEHELRRAVGLMAKAIREGDNSVHEAVIAYAAHFPAEWQSRLAEALTDFTDAENPGVVLSDGTPLLSAPTPSGDDDIPF